MVGECPPDLASFLASPESTEGYTAQVGCGLTQVRTAPGFSSSTYAFDADGKLVGFALVSDQNGGPCEGAEHRRGQLLTGCADVTSCAIGPDATAEAICASGPGDGGAGQGGN